MQSHQTTRSVSRRAALAGLGAGGIGLALGEIHAAAQDAPTELAAHSIVGAWHADFDPANPGTLFVYTSFHADGTRSDLHPFAGAGIGVWEATGERTGRSVLKYQNIATAPGEFVEGTVTVWGTVTVAEDGNSFAEESVIELRGSDGKVIAGFPFSGGSRRLMVEPPPPLETPDATPAS